MRYHFAFRSHYAGQSDFVVYDREARAERRLRFRRDTGAASYVGEACPDDVLEAFNAWRLAEREVALGEIRRKYGDAHADACPPFVRAVAA